MLLHVDVEVVVAVFQSKMAHHTILGFDAKINVTSIPGVDMMMLLYDLGTHFLIHAAPELYRAHGLQI